MSGFDIIGDIHGCSDKLRGLLHQLGYRERAGAFRHPGREAIFVGDLIDRGPGQVDTVTIVRSMVDAGTARVTMGNHEFNAISFVTPDPETPGAFMRPHGTDADSKNREQHGAFLEQVGEGSKLHLEYIKWFRTFPLWLDLKSIRIVHACWHDDSIKALTALLGGNAPIRDDFVVAANTKGNPAFNAVETVIKGPEVELGQNRAFLDPEAHQRTAARIRWWDPEAVTLRGIAEIPRGSTTPDLLPYPSLPDEPSPAAEEYRYNGVTPVVFGHYWRTGRPRVDGRHSVCVDFSAIKGGPLVAYRWDGESELVDANLRAFGGH